MLLKIKRIISRIRGLFPEALPVGMTEFTLWANKVIRDYNPPGTPDSVKFALATSILHSGPTMAFKSRYHFSLVIRAAAAKQIAGAQFQEIKLRDMARREAEQKKAAEVTVQSEVSNG